MSTAGLFAVGVVVTLIVGSALGLLVWGIVLDGRDEKRRKTENSDRERRGVIQTAGTVTELTTVVPSAQR